MHTDGMTVNQIAANSGLTTAEVDSYLGISTSVTAAGGGGAPAGGGHAPRRAEAKATRQVAAAALRVRRQLKQLRRQRRSPRLFEVGGGAGNVDENSRAQG
jgi:hypothetical protein